MTQTQEAVRSRTFTWTDPATHAGLVGTRSGLEVLQGMGSGEIPPPPIMKLVDIAEFTAEEGTVTVRLDPQEFHYNPLGSMHGGIISTLLDTACGCSVHTTLPAGLGYTSLDLSVKFLRPVTMATGPITAEGNVVHLGRRTALAEAKIVDEAGKLYATATSTCMILRPGD